MATELNIKAFQDIDVSNSFKQATCLKFRFTGVIHYLSPLEILIQLLTLSNMKQNSPLVFQFNMF